MKLKKLLMLSGIACMAVTLSLAQYPSSTGSAPASSPSQSQSQPTADNPSQSSSTLRGCLSGSSGSYVLTESQTGTVYALTGMTDNLSSRVGHEVEVTGQVLGNSGNATSPSGNASNPSSSSSSPSTSTSSGSTSSSTTSSSSGTGTTATMQISSVNDVADHCGAGSSGASTGTATQNPSD